MSTNCKSLRKLSTKQVELVMQSLGRDPDPQELAELLASKTEAKAAQVVALVNEQIVRAMMRAKEFLDAGNDSVKELINYVHPALSPETARLWIMQYELQAFERELEQVRQARFAETSDSIDLESEMLELSGAQRKALLQRLAETEDPNRLKQTWELSEFSISALARILEGLKLAVQKSIGENGNAPTLQEVVADTGVPKIRIRAWRPGLAEKRRKTKGLCSSVISLIRALLICVLILGALYGAYQCWQGHHRFAATKEEFMARMAKQVGEPVQRLEQGLAKRQDYIDTLTALEINVRKLCDTWGFECYLGGVGFKLPSICLNEISEKLLELDRDSLAEAGSVKTYRAYFSSCPERPQIWWEDYYFTDKYFERPGFLTYTWLELRQNLIGPNWQGFALMCVCGVLILLLIISSDYDYIFERIETYIRALLRKGRDVILVSLQRWIERKAQRVKPFLKN